MNEIWLFFKILTFLHKLGNSIFVDFRENLVFYSWYFFLIFTCKCAKGNWFRFWHVKCQANENDRKFVNFPLNPTMADAEAPPPTHHPPSWSKITRKNTELRKKLRQTTAWCCEHDLGFILVRVVTLPTQTFCGHQSIYLLDVDHKHL